MQLDLVFVGLSNRHQADWNNMCENTNARPWFFDDIEMIGEQNFTSPEVLIAPFVESSAFQDLNHQYRLRGAGHVAVAILTRPEYADCARAFRAGADDVVSQPFARPEFEALIRHLCVILARSIHPDAILPLDIVEKTAICSALKACNGQVSKTSRKLGIGRSTLYRKLEQYGLMERS